MKYLLFVALLIGLACLEVWDLTRCQEQVFVACSTNYYMEEVE